jgi:hypothetical protein
MRATNIRQDSSRPPLAADIAGSTAMTRAFATLANTYWCRLTEGFDIADLKEAKALLDQLGA